MFSESVSRDALSDEANEGGRGVCSGAHEAGKKGARSRARSWRGGEPDEKERHGSPPVSRVWCFALPCVFGGEARFEISAAGRTCERMQSTHIPAGLGGMPMPHMQHRTCPGACCCWTPNIVSASWPEMRGSLTAATTARTEKGWRERVPFYQTFV